MPRADLNNLKFFHCNTLFIDVIYGEHYSIHTALYYKFSLT